MRIDCPLKAAVLLTLVACSPAADTTTAPRTDYLYLWSASSDSTQPDFLAVLDVTEDSARYGRLVTTLPVPGLRNGPHHTEHEMPADGQLFANGFGSGKSFIFDLTDGAKPRIAGGFADVEGYMHPHSYLRLPNGNVLATFQMRHDSSGMSVGGIAEVTPAGQVVRTSSASAPGIDPQTKVYSAGIVPALDRIVTTTTDMDADYPGSRQLQIWRLSDLKVLHTIKLPDGPKGGEGLLSAEPRVLGDGRYGSGVDVQLRLVSHERPRLRRPFSAFRRIVSANGRHVLRDSRGGRQLLSGHRAGVARRGQSRHQRSGVTKGSESRDVRRRRCAALDRDGARSAASCCDGIQRNEASRVDVAVRSRNGTVVH